MLLLFKRGLKPEIRARIETLPDDFLPKSFHGYAEFVDKQERELKANRHAISFRKESDKKSKSKPHDRQDQTPKTPLDTESEEKDEDGDTIMGGLNLIRPELNFEEKAEWMKDCRNRNLCFKCDKEGHKVNACKNPIQGKSKDKKEGKERSH